ncbi:MAG: pyruvate kinase [Bacteroidota bacterium]
MSAFNPRRTKIVATLGPATSEKKVLVELVKAGMDVARLNFSHADHETHAKNLHTVRKINEELNTNIAILQDLQGPKIRIGDLIKPVKIKPGDVVTLRSDLGKQEKEGGEIPIRYETFAQDVSEGESILMDDGKIQAEVIGSNKKNKVQLKIIFGEEIKSRKGVNLPDTPISLSTITEKDFKDIEFAIEHQVEWLALSFVRSADDIRVLKELIRLKNGTSRIIAKIEKPEALENIDEIIQAADGIMVARGDLGVEIPMEQVPVWQKKIIRKSNQAAKPVILATQVMESMIENPRPTRAEANDAANALADGADAVMLSGETSVGKYPVRVVSSMDSILRNVEAEEEDIYYRLLDDVDQEEGYLSVAITKTACKLARETNAKAIIAMTSSGYTAIQLSQCRPKGQIFAFSNNRPVLNTLNLVWGVKAFYYDSFESTDQTIQDVHEILKDNDLVQTGDIMINTGSMPLHEMGLTNMIKISRVRGKNL